MHIVWLNMVHSRCRQGQLLIVLLHNGTNNIHGMFMIHVLSFQLKCLIMVIYKEWIHHNAKLRCCENILRFSCAPITFSFSFSFPSPKNIKIKIKMNTVLLCTSYSVMEFKRIWIQCNYCVKKV